MKLSRAIVMFVLVLASCGNAKLEPVAIEESDMCNFCRMSISEKRYAAELIDKDGEVFKFDDIGCMANFIKQKKPEVRASFVMDYDHREWLKGEEAFYVRSPQFKTPMSGGIAAFKDESKAKLFQGTTLRFAELTTP